LNWDETADKKLVALREQGKSFSEVAARLTLELGQGEISKDACQARYQRVAGEYLFYAGPEARYMPYYYGGFDDAGKPYTTTPKLSLEKYLLRRSTESDTLKILHVSDLHVAEHDEELLVRAFNENLDADVVVVAGDALDIYAYSRFARNRNRPIEREIEEWMRIQTEYLAKFPIVLIIDSNHAQRVPRAISIPDGLQFLVEPNIMRYLAQPFTNIIAYDDWYVQIGDAIFAHGDYAVSTAPKAAEQVAGWFSLRAKSDQFPQIHSFNLLVQAHTHRVGCVVTSGVKVIESGCLARLPLEYTATMQSAKYKQLQSNGYAVVVQKNGRSVLNDSREFYLEAGRDRRTA
jgi:hypothetical protein